MIKAKLNLVKIDKSKIFAGEKGKYIDICLIERRDEYGNDYMVVQDVSKEDRLNGIKGAVLGNAKIIGQPAGRARDITPKDDVTDAPRKPAPGVEEDILF